MGTKWQINYRNRVCIYFSDFNLFAFVFVNYLGGKKGKQKYQYFFLYWNRAEVIRRIDEYSASLVIEHILSEHSGNYTCICSNVAGTERFNVQVTVNVPPKWILQPKDSSVQAGENISLHCQADGWPKPIVAWSEYTLNWPFNFS